MAQVFCHKREAQDCKRGDRKQANWEANNGRCVPEIVPLWCQRYLSSWRCLLCSERKDLYTDAWAGDKWKGSKFNILSLVVILFLLTPVAGLVFAYVTYGSLWG
eukprot:jgi/Astpho2/2084/Aster-00571